jgi:hypothetical protein
MAPGATLTMVPPQCLQPRTATKRPWHPMTMGATAETNTFKDAAFTSQTSGKKGSHVADIHFTLWSHTCNEHSHCHCHLLPHITGTWCPPSGGRAMQPPWLSWPAWHRGQG